MNVEGFIFAYHCLTCVEKLMEKVGCQSSKCVQAAFMHKEAPFNLSPPIQLYILVKRAAAGGNSFNMFHALP